MASAKDSLFCIVCIRQDSKGNLRTCRNKERAFLLDGYSNWKKATTRFREHENSQCHKTAIDFQSNISQRYQHIAEIKSSIAAKTMKRNRRCLVKILECLQYLCRQGLPIRGSTDNESNLIQLLKLRGKDDPDILDWLTRNTDKYLGHDIQHEMCIIMRNSVTRQVISKIKDRYFSIIADEYTDISNKEHLTLCLRWVDNNFDPHEDFIGFYNIPNIKSDTIASVIKDIIIRVCLSLDQCRGQCYDGASNMLGKKSGVAKRIQECQPKAYPTHCFGHSLNLSVKDATKSCKVLSDSMNTAREIIILIKYSPKRQRC